MQDKICQSQKFLSVLQNKQKAIGERYQAIFQLKNLNSVESIQCLMNAYQHVQPSVLLTHEILYTLGQVNEEFFPLIEKFLFDIVQNETESGIARHEAAEALANYFSLIPTLEKLFQKYVTSECQELSDTCKISLGKIKHKELAGLYGRNFHGTRQPAAPFEKKQFQAFLEQKKLQQTMKEEGFLGILLKPQAEISLFEKYRILYFMRNLGSKNQKRILCELLSKAYSKTQSNLLKHEICFILGQIGVDEYQSLIRQCIQNQDEAEIVRHEALAAVASQSKDINYLQKFLDHPSRLIRQSAQVAEFSIKYWNQ